MGAILASLTLRYRQVTAIFGFFNFAFQTLTDMFIPLQLLPIPLQILGQSLPQTFGVDLLRYYVMKTTPIMAVNYEWIILLGQFLVLCIIARLAIVYLERTAKEPGLHYI